jgi:hypothetical protein
MAFLTGLQITHYLHKNGYGVSKSTVYNHINAGYLRKDIEGVYNLQDVREYAEKHLRNHQPGPEPTEEIKYMWRQIEKIMLADNLKLQKSLRAQLAVLCDLVDISSELTTHLEIPKGGNGSVS